MYAIYCFIWDTLGCIVSFIGWSCVILGYFMCCRSGREKIEVLLKDAIQIKERQDMLKKAAVYRQDEIQNYN